MEDRAELPEHDGIEALERLHAGEAPLFVSALRPAGGVAREAASERGIGGETLVSCTDRLWQVVWLAQVQELAVRLELFFRVDSQPLRHAFVRIGGDPREVHSVLVEGPREGTGFGFHADGEQTRDRYSALVHTGDQSRPEPTPFGICDGASKRRFEVRVGQSDEFCASVDRELAASRGSRRSHRDPFGPSAQVPTREQRAVQLNHAGLPFLDAGRSTLDRRRRAACGRPHQPRRGL